MSYTRRSYHCNTAPWRSERGGLSNLQGRFIGIELEVESDNHHDVLRALPDIKGANRPHVETDGSLTDEGLEIIFPPISYSTLKRDNSVVARVMRAIRSVCYTDGTTGMHINVNTNGWPDPKIARFVSVFHLMKQRDLERLGGRRLNDYCEQANEELVEWGNECDDLPYDYVNSRTFLTHLVGHSYCAERSQNRVELRFPGATTNPLRLRSLVDFVRCVEAFVDTNNYPERILSGMPLAEAQTLLQNKFRKYLAGSKRYKHLLMIIDEGFLEYEQSIVNPSTPASANGAGIGGAVETARAA